MAERKAGFEKKWYTPMLAKSLDADGTPVVRYAFTSDKMDEGGDIITRKATEKAVKDWRQWRNIRLQHNPDRPIGKAIKIGEEDGLEWNQMDVRVDDPSVLPLVMGDDPVLGGASVGIIVNEFEVNDDDEAKERAGFWEPWIITDYTFVEISLVDHPMNYDAKRVGEVTEESRGRVLFRRRDGRQKEAAMSEQDVLEQEVTEAEITPDPEPEVEQSVEQSVDQETPAPEADASDGVEREGGDPDSAFESRSLELLEGISTKLDGLGAVMALVHKALTPEPEAEPDVTEAAVDGLAEGEPDADEGETPLAALSRDVAALTAEFAQLRERLFSTEAEDAPEAQGEEPDLEALVRGIVAEEMEARAKLKGRVSQAVPPEPEEAEPEEETSPSPLDPRERLRTSVRRAFNTSKE